MSQPSGYNPASLSQQPVSNYFTNKNWVTIDQRGLIYTTYTRGPSNENTFYEQLPFLRDQLSQFQISQPCHISDKKNHSVNNISVLKK